MKVIGTPGESSLLGAEGLYATIGNFDGLHLGHRAVIAELMSSSRATGGAVAVTFEPHPASVVGSGGGPGRLTPREEKAELLSETGLAELLVVPFTKEIAGSSARSFLERIGIGSGAHLVLGYDFHMGRGRATDLGRLSMLGREIGFGLDVVAPVLYDGSPISSTRVREALRASDVRAAGEMLGRPYRIAGIVARGKGLGASMGVPTANLEVPEGKLLPGDGVYVVSLPSMGDRRGLMYVGRRPTLGGGSVSVEVHVLDIEREMYDSALAVDVLGFMRADRAFSSTEELAQQMRQDIERARRQGGV